MPSLVLSPITGTSTIELIGSSPGIRLDYETSPEAILPVPQFDEAYAESVDTEGGKQVYSRPSNPVAAGRVLITASDASTLYGYIRTWQRAVEAVRKYGGTLVYTPDSGTAVTYDLVSMRITSIPQDWVMLRQFVAVSAFEFTCRPFGRLASVALVSGLSSSHPTIAIDLGDRAYSTVVLADTPRLYWRLGAGGTTDSSGNARNGTGGGGITIGGATGALANDSDTATTFDGVDDRVTSTDAVYTAAIRCFEVWGYRTNTAADHTLIAGDGGVSAPSLKILSGGTDVRFRFQDNSALATSTTTWSGAWPGNLVYTHVFLIVDQPNGTAELWINGVSQGIKTGLTIGYSTPGNFLLGAFGSTFTQPFNGRLDEAATYSARVTGERIIAHYVAGVERLAVSGSTEGWGQITLTDQATTNRNHVEWGIEENYNPAAPTPTLITSINLDTSGFAGSGNTRAGAFDPVGAGNTVIRATLTGVPVVACGTGSQAHVGRWRIRARVYQAGTGTCRVRLRWRVGKADAFTANPYVTLGPAAQWYEPDLGLVDIPSALVGTQSWEGWIESYSSVTGDTIDVNFVTFVPASRYGKARGPLVAETSGNFSARDEFDQTAGAVTGKTLPVGGTWQGAGDADDAVVDTATHTLQRTATSDVDANTGRYLRASTPSLTATSVQCDAMWTTATGGMLTGVLARYTDTNNWVGLWIRQTGGVTGTGSVLVQKRVAGTVSTIASIGTSILWGQAATWYTMRLTIDADGNFAIWVGVTGSPLGAPALSGNDPVLATGGTLASGQVGIYDTSITATASTRSYDNFAAWVPTLNPHVINSGKRLLMDYQSALREPSSGTAWGRVPTYEGNYSRIPTAGNENRVSRLVVKARSFDIDQVASSAPAKLGVDVSVTPRVVLLG